jgi:hypothetical protein
MSVVATTSSAYAQLAGREIRNYLMSKLFWVGSALLVVTMFQGMVTGVSTQSRGALDGVAPGALIGVLGIVIMAGLVRKSYQAAAAAGAVAVPERTRTYALASAVVVPFAVGLLWFLAYAIWWSAGETDGTGPFGAHAGTFTLATMFQEGTMATLGGPLLGLVIGRWIRRRWVAPVVAVLIVPVTMLFQGGLWPATDGFRGLWVWNHFQGPMGIINDDMRWVILPGSPYFHILYQLARCTLGVLFAAYHDPELGRRGIRQAAAATGVVAVVACGLAITGGASDYVVSPTPTAHAGNGSNAQLDVTG